jgi:hypothetical protein
MIFFEFKKWHTLCKIDPEYSFAALISMFISSLKVGRNKAERKGTANGLYNSYGLVV